MGTQAQADDFFAMFGSPPVLRVSDNERELYRLFDVSRLEIKRLISPPVLRAAVQAHEEGFRQGRVVGAPLQMHASVLIKNGVVLEAHRPSSLDEDLRMTELLECGDNLCQIP